MSEQSLPADRAALLGQINELGRVSRRYLPILILSLLAGLACLAMLTVQLQHKAKRLETANATLNQTHQDDSRNWSAAKAAFAARDFRLLGRLLDVYYREAEVTAQAVPGLPAGPIATTAAIAPARLERLSVAKARPQQVFVQFAGLIARADVAALNKALRGVGWDVQGPDGERTGKAAGLNEVRFNSAEDKPAAEALAAALTRAGIGNRPVTTKQLGIIRPGTLEAWISR